MLVRQQSGTVKTPQTRAELQALVGRRDELKSQLRDAENRRLNLAAQLGPTPTSAQGPVRERIAATDARIAQLERQVTSMDQAISNALADPKLSQGEWSLLEKPPTPPDPTSVPAPPGEAGTIVPPPQSGPPDVVGRVLLVSGIGAIMLAVLAGYIAWRAAVRRFSKMTSGANPTHMAQLQQSIDAIALEVERISENQRYVTKIVNSLGAGAAEPVHAAEKEKDAARRG
jgi:hypothetical protein